MSCAGKVFGQLEEQKEVNVTRAVKEEERSRLKNPRGKGGGEDCIRIYRRL